MSFKLSSLNTSRRLISCDPSFVNTAIAAWEWDKANRRRKLLEYRAVKDTSNSNNLADRIDTICTQCLSFSEKHSADFFVIERPPQTLYGQSGPLKTAKQASQRAQSIFKLCYIVGGVIQLHLYKLPKIKMHWIEPSQWQPSAKDRGLQTTKEWSLFEANELIGDRLNPLKNHNIADAIMIGWVAIDKLETDTFPSNQSFSY